MTVFLLELDDVNDGQVIVMSLIDLCSIYVLV